MGWMCSLGCLVRPTSVGAHRSRQEGVAASDSDSGKGVCVMIDGSIVSQSCLLLVEFVLVGPDGLGDDGSWIW